MTNGAATPEAAASRYTLAMPEPKAPRDGWVARDDRVGGEVVVINGDWRFLTTRLSDGTWIVTGGERCDSGQ